jgi:hypothetical protein
VSIANASAISANRQREVGVACTASRGESARRAVSTDELALGDFVFRELRRAGDDRIELALGGVNAEFSFRHSASQRVVCDLPARSAFVIRG